MVAPSSTSASSPSSSLGYTEKSVARQGNCTYGDEELRELQRAVYEVTFPVLIAVGVVTNLVDLVVLSRPAMKGVSYRYLARLAFSDLLYLVFNIPFCLRDFNRVASGEPVGRLSAVYFGHLGIPVVNVCLTMSIYIVVWLSYDRCLAVCSPQKFSAKQRLGVVRLRCCVALIVTLLVYMPFPLRQRYLCDEGSSCCVYDSDLIKNPWYVGYEFFREIYSRIVPAILITAFNATIINTLRRTTKARIDQGQSEDVISEARIERERRLVFLLLAITVFFYISALPSAIYKIIMFKKGIEFLPYFRAVADVLEVSGHVFNFVLYFLFSPDFRKTLLSLVGQNLNNQAPTAASSATFHP